MHEEIKLIQYGDLTELLLNVIQLRPAMYLGEAKISNLPTFIIGYRLNPSAKDDKYFGDKGFMEWLDYTYQFGHPNSWCTLFLNLAANDEKEALKIYFKYLEEYHNDTAWINL